MIKIINKLNQRIMINLSGSRNLNLLAGGSVSVSETELASPHLQALLNKKYIAVVHAPKVDPELSLSRTKPLAANPNPKPTTSPIAKQTKGRMKGNRSNK